ncbi:MAG TPA: hypothetical protein VMS32_01585 [Verrucomicrobiae bacterium]|nr:hypothetical protein [Verrucomicrobiae bacterium]
MKFATLRYDGLLDTHQRGAVQTRLRTLEARVVWHNDDATRRTYAAVESSRDFSDEQLRSAVADARAYPRSVIALAVTPRPAEALPVLLEALGGPGRPAGVLDCAIVGDELCVEWDSQVTAAALITVTLDAELARFNGTRTTRLLRPLGVEAIVKVAADGLGATQLDPQRILEVLLGASRGDR